MWIERRNCFDSDRMYEMEMGWRYSDGYPLVAHL